MRRLLIRMSFAALARVGGLEPSIRLWRPAVVASLRLHPHFQRPIKNPDLSRGLVLIAHMHSDPQDTTPQMTRLPVILTMSRLKVLSITSIHLSLNFEHNCSTTCGASGRTRTCVHFVRSEGHQSSLARTLKTLVGELRIELRPRAPKARMQRITLFPDGASPAS